MELIEKDIITNLKGFRRSAKPCDNQYSISDQAMVVSKFIENRTLNNLYLIGHSLGGGVSLGKFRIGNESKSLEFSTYKEIYESLTRPYQSLRTEKKCYSNR